jgi:diguanylate cyclase (GGDEF)-like protein
VPNRRVRLLLRAMLCAFFVGWLVFGASTVWRPQGTRNSLFDAWLYDGVEFTGAFLVLLRALLVKPERTAWIAMGLGLMLSACGDVVYSGVVVHQTPEPFPSFADPLYLSFYPGAYIALVLLLRAGFRKLPASAWFDGTIAGLGLAAVAAAWAFGPIEDSASGNAVAVAVGLAYPVGDLLLLAIAVGALAMFGWRADARWRFLAVGMILFAFADTQYLLLSAKGMYTEGTWLDAVWPTALAMIVIAAWRPAPAKNIRRYEGWALLIPALLFSAAAIALLALDHVRRLSNVSIALAVVTLSAAAIKLALGHREGLQVAAETRRLAFTDDLTGLGNRRMLGAHLDSAERTSVPFGLLLIDLDRFKEINDSLGHSAGDDLLRQVGNRFASRCRAGDLLVRLGGDEFAVVVHPVADSSFASEAGEWNEPQDVAEQLLAALDRPMQVGGMSVHIAASIGIAYHSLAAYEADQLLQRADVAMYEAKSSHTRIVVYSAGRDPNSVDRLQTIEDLRDGIKRGEIVCYYQPQIDLQTGRVLGVEALARWEHPLKGTLSPGDFLPLAEGAGLIGSMTVAVLRAALQQCRQWRDDGRQLRMSVNLSPTTLLDENTPELVRGLLAEFGLPSSLLTLEITEDVLVADGARALRALQQLRLFGVQIALDDYGTGYCSLAYLRDLPVDELKIDGTFVALLEHDIKTAAIVRSTIALAHDLGLIVVAEGVETRPAADWLTRHGCDIGQGFVFARPLRPTTLELWMDESQQSLAEPSRQLSRLIALEG